MSVFEFMAAIDGYNKAHNPDSDKSLSGEETDDIWDWLKTKDPVVTARK